MTNKKYNIIKDRVELYKDFTFNLLYYIYNYYLDPETLSKDQDIYNHYNWCYNKVCDEFKLEEINFSDNIKLKKYFYSYYYQQFYSLQTNNSVSLSYYEKFWNNIFDVDKQKNKNMIRVLIELYSIYDKSINYNENILEII